MYETKNGRVKGTILFFVTALVYNVLSVFIVRGLGLESIGWARFILTIPQMVLLAVGGVKLRKTAEQSAGKVIGIVFIVLAVVILILAVRLNIIAQYF